MPASPNSDHVERISNKFYRAQEGDHVRAGTSLSLAIARGFAEPLRNRSRLPIVSSGVAPR